MGRGDYGGLVQRLLLADRLVEGLKKVVGQLKAERILRKPPGLNLVLDMIAVSACQG